ncbi:unnamed protein product [Amoebophrya sp. A120]|nr:unnamed protein product [Amoebophrya sp. A120]|eukprot:GSA120T00001172001.1
MDTGTKQFFLERKEEDPENGKCCDCGAPHPQWASVNLGCYFCLLCSGQHRGLGVHISFVRSITMDTWSDKQKASMQKGGNARLKKALEDNGVSASGKINEKYNTKAAEWYRQTLRAEVMGEPLPPLLAPGTGPLPAFEAPAASTAAATGSITSNGGGSSSSSSSGGMTGFGSAPPPQQDRGGNNGDDLFGAAAASLWGFAGTAAAFASKAKDAAVEKAKQIEIPQDSQSFMQSVGTTMNAGLNKAKELSAKTYETVTDEQFLEKVKAKTAETVEKSKELAAQSYEKSREYAEYAQVIVKEKLDENGFPISGTNGAMNHGMGSSGSSYNPGSGGGSSNFAGSSTTTYGNMPPPASQNLPDPHSAGNTSGDAFGSLADDLDFLNTGMAANSTSSAAPINTTIPVTTTSAGTMAQQPPPPAPVQLGQGGTSVNLLGDAAPGSNGVVAASKLDPAISSGGNGDAKKPGDDWLDDFADF